MDGPEVSSRDRILLSNSAWNLLRAVSNSAVVVLVPLILVYQLPTSEFTLWALAFSISSLLLYLDLGLYPTIRTQVSASFALRDPSLGFAWTIVGCKILGFVALSGLLLALLASPFFPYYFEDLSSANGFEVAAATVILTAGQGSLLLLNGVASYFSGLQRSARPAIVASLSRLCSALAVIGTAAWSNDDLVQLALAYSIPACTATALLSWMFLRERPPDYKAAPHQRVDVRRVLTFTGPLILWSVCVLTVSGLGTVIVGIVDFGGVPAFAVGTSLGLAIAGVSNAVMSPLLPELSSLWKKSQTTAFEEMVRTWTHMNVAILSFGCAIGWPTALIVGSTGGADFDLRFLVTACVLMSSAALRLVMTPLTMAFISSGRHGRVIWPPVVDALVTLALSLAGGILFGAVGVAVGQLAGASVSVLLSVRWAAKRTQMARISSRLGLGSVLWRATVSLLPSAVCVLFYDRPSPLGWGTLSSSSVAVGVTVSCTLTVLLLVPTEKRAQLGRYLVSHVRRGDV